MDKRSVLARPYLEWSDGFGPANLPLPIFRSMLKDVLRGAQIQALNKLSYQIVQGGGFGDQDMFRKAVAVVMADDRAAVKSGLTESQPMSGRARRRGPQETSLAEQNDERMFRLVLHHAIKYERPEIKKRLFQQFPFCSSAESAKFNDSSEDEVLTAIMHLADEEALDLLMGLGLGRVTTEWRLSEYERELRGLKTYLATPSGLTPAEHKVLLMLEADGSLAACESALRKLRLPSGLPKGLHKAIEDFGKQFKMSTNSN